MVCLILQKTMEDIINKVAQSGLITLDLEELWDDAPRAVLDIKEHLFMGLMLKEKEFRDFIKTNDWEQYKGKYVSIICSSDAIVPTWAYMLIGTKLSGISKGYVFGNSAELESLIYRNKLSELDLEPYKNQRVVLKGCSKKEVPVSAYVYATELLTPLVKSLMFGEPCSTVPLFKRA